MDPNNDLPKLSTCTTCRFKEDASNYWTAVLFFKHANGSFIRVLNFCLYFHVHSLIFFPKTDSGPSNGESGRRIPQRRHDCLLYPAIKWKSYCF